MKENKELKEALELLEKEKDISKETLLEAIENSLIQACKTHFGGKADNVKAIVDRETYNFSVYAEREVVEEVEDPLLQISLEAAREIDPHLGIGDVAQVQIKSREFGRIATQNAKNVILQKIREEERKVLFNQYYGKEKEVVTGIVQRYLGKNVSINLGKVDAMLNENEQVRGETFFPTERIKVYILEVRDMTKGPRILVSRTHPELVKRLFESEVTEVKDGTVEIKSIAREAGSRTKMAVSSNDPNVDPVGACVGLNGARVGAVVEELRGEKIDIINWSDNSAILIENALSPAKVICVVADDDEKTAQVIVPDYQLSLAIGKEGQNARLAARLTGFKIDIKSETQARESGLLEEIGYEEGLEGEYESYEDYDYEEGYPEDGYGDGYEEGYPEEEYPEEGYADGGEGGEIPGGV
ncbi:MAG: transcription termination/antitermination protein NusA [Lachnospiraceae bacterium]|nr:transcription termination/antitermination protein NusA [Lachnospiraceae bacterium]